MAEKEKELEAVKLNMKIEVERNLKGDFDLRLSEITEQLK